MPIPDIPDVLSSDTNVSQPFSSFSSGSHKKGSFRGVLMRRTHVSVALGLLCLLNMRSNRLFGQECQEWKVSRETGRNIHFDVSRITFMSENKRSSPDFGRERGFEPFCPPHHQSDRSRSSIEYVTVSRTLDMVPETDPR